MRKFLTNEKRQFIHNYRFIKVGQMPANSEKNSIWLSLLRQKDQSFETCLV